jgi:hypothetical protein
MHHYSIQSANCIASHSVLTKICFPEEKNRINLIIVIHVPTIRKYKYVEVYNNALYTPSPLASLGKVTSHGLHFQRTL